MRIKLYNLHAKSIRNKIPLPRYLRIDLVPYGQNCEAIGLKPNLTKAKAKPPQERFV